MVVGHTLLVSCTGDMTVVFINSIFQTSAGLYYVGKVTNFFWAGPFVDKIFALLVMEFYLWGS